MHVFVYLLYVRLICAMSHLQMLMNVLTARSAVKGFVRIQMVHTAASVTRGTRIHWMGKAVWVSSCFFLTPLGTFEVNACVCLICMHIVIVL